MDKIVDGTERNLSFDRKENLSLDCYARLGPERFLAMLEMTNSSAALSLEIIISKVFPRSDVKKSNSVKLSRLLSANINRRPYVITSP